MSKIDASQVVNRLTLSAILSALREYGIHVSSPAEEIARGATQAQAKAKAPAEAPAEVPFDILITALQDMGINVTGGPSAENIAAATTAAAAGATGGTSQGSPCTNKERASPAAASLAGDIAATIVAANPGLVPDAPEEAKPIYIITSTLPAPSAAPAPSDAPAPAAAPTPSVTPTTPSTEDVQAAGTPSGFLCTFCNKYNVVASTDAGASSSEPYYTVTAGRAVGVFRGWHHVQPLVSGVPHAGFKKYKTKGAAVQAFEEAKAAGTVMTIA